VTLQRQHSEAIQEPSTPPGSLRSARDDALVSFEKVGKSFGAATALRALDFDVYPGETLTLLGPSGCGKSTALRLLAGLAQPTSGEIRWNCAAAREKIGFVFQEATLLPWADVFANVYLPLRLAGVARRDAAPRVSEALELVGLAQFPRALPRELSGGMKMRCAIARALVMRPALLLMDEPFAALDEVTRWKLNDELLTLKARLGATIVFVTHSVLESAFLSTRVVVLAAKGGGIVDEIAVDPKLKRDADFRLSSEFMSVCRRASQALQRAMSEARP